MAHTFKTRFAIRILILICLVAALPGGLALAAPGDTTRVSISSSGVQANAASRRSAISSDANYVAFESDASDLVSDDTNSVTDIFVRDRGSGITERISLANDGSQANDWSEFPAISADGRYVAFASMASNLVSGDTNGIMDVFVRDRQTGQTVRASVDFSGAQATGDEWTTYSSIAISGDGRFVVFSSNIATLVSGDTNGVMDVFVHDFQTGETRRVSVASNGEQSNGDSMAPDISGDGMLIVFASQATNLVPGDTNGKTDIFLRSLLIGQTTRLSVSSSGAEANKDSSDPVISYTGQYVAFSSEADNLVPGSEYMVYESLYLRNLSTGEITLASVWSSGDIMVGWAMLPTISADGRYVAFEYDDKGDGDGVLWIYVHDRVTGKTISATEKGRPDEQTAPFNPSFSATGQFLAFESGNATLVSNDTNGVIDVFVREVPSFVDDVPVVNSINRADANPAFASQTIHYTMSFSEPVTGVDVGDFALTRTGNTGAAAITNVESLNGSSSLYVITISTGNGKGTLRLDLIDNDSIKDSIGQPLGGVGAGNGNYTSAPIFNIFVLQSALFRSNGTNDGWVLESGENTNAGGSLNATATTFYLGDNAQDRQFRALLHFPTSTLPDNAVISSAILKIKKQSVTGTDPFTTHGNVLVDIRYGAFSGSNAVQVGDFQAAASRNAVGTFFNAPSSSWYSTTLNVAAFPYINLVGVTQFRLAFQLDDNDDLGADTIQFYSGNYGDLAYRPQLQVLYYVP